MLFNPASILNVEDLGFNVEFGPKVSLTRYFGDNYGLEVNYFGIDAWTASAQRSNAQIPILFPSGVMASTRFGVDYSSELHSSELNLRRRFGGGSVELLAGFRYAELHEAFRIQGDPVPVSSPNTPIYTTNASNYLYGFQLGLDARLLGCDGLLSRGGWGDFMRRLGRPDSLYSGNLRVDALLKGGVFGNHGRQDTFRSGNLGIPLRAGDQQDRVAFIGEVALTGVWQLTENLAARGGYQAMWIEGVALAPDQIPFTSVTPLATPTASLNTSGSLFYHGFHLGLEARW